MLFFSPIRTTYLAHLILLDLVTQKIRYLASSAIHEARLGDFSPSSSWDLLLKSIRFPEYMWETEFHIHTKHQANCNLVSTFLGIRRARKKFCTEFNLLVIACLMQFWYVIIIPKHCNCATLPQDLLAVLAPSLCLTLCSLDVNEKAYFTGRLLLQPASVLSTNKPSVLFVAFISLPSKFTLAQNRI